MVNEFQKHHTDKPIKGREDSGGTKLADEAIKKSKTAIKRKPLPQPEKAKRY